MDLTWWTLLHDEVLARQKCMIKRTDIFKILCSVLDSNKWRQKHCSFQELLTLSVTNLTSINNVKYQLKIIYFHHFVASRPFYSLIFKIRFTQQACLSCLLTKAYLLSLAKFTPISLLPVLLSHRSHYNDYMKIY